jgi:hypothetical protein
MEPEVRKSAEYFLRVRSVCTIRPLTLRPPGPAAADHKPVSQRRTAHQQPQETQNKKWVKGLTGLLTRRNSATRRSSVLFSLTS